MKKIPRPDLTPQLSPMTPRAHHKWLKGRTVWPAINSPLRRVSWRHPGVVADAIEDGQKREAAKARRSGWGSPSKNPIDFVAVSLAAERRSQPERPVVRTSPRESLVYAYKNPRHMRAA